LIPSGETRKFAGAVMVMKPTDGARFDAVTAEYPTGAELVPGVTLPKLVTAVDVKAGAGLAMIAV
jgi:hypothetical protein